MQQFEQQAFYQQQQQKNDKKKKQPNSSYVLDDLIYRNIEEIDNLSQFSNHLLMIPHSHNQSVRLDLSAFESVFSSLLIFISIDYHLWIHESNIKTRNTAWYYFHRNRKCAEIWIYYITQSLPNGTHTRIYNWLKRSFLALWTKSFEYIGIIYGIWKSITYTRFINISLWFFSFVFFFCGRNQRYSVFIRWSPCRVHPFFFSFTSYSDYIIYGHFLCKQNYDLIKKN